MRRIFLDNALESQFRKDGYLVMPFLEGSEIQELRTYFENEVSRLEGNFYMSLWTKDLANRQAADAKINAIFEPHSGKILDNYKCIISSFGVKHPASDSGWFVHQDDTFVDESKFTSVSIWVPLLDVNEQNGALQIVRGSHEIYTDKRAPTITKPFHEYRDWMKDKQLETISMKAGEAFFFDHRMIHASGPNLSDQLRLISVSVMAPKESQILFYYQNKERQGEVETLNLVDDFYRIFPLGDKPKGEGVSAVGFSPLSVSEISENDFLEKQAAWEKKAN